MLAVDEAVKHELIAAERDLEEALRARDEATIRKWLAEDFVSVHSSSGSRESAASMIPSILRGQTAAVAAITAKYDQEVKLIGRDGALVTETVKSHLGGRSLWQTTVLVWRKAANT